jgi:hypothetical protein
MVLLAGSGASVLAQPVASIALPDPGGVEQLYAGCNNISLTFPDATPSQTVVQAVTPAGTVETLWRFNGPLNKFEGFSPAFPQASDLMSVNFLDAVWLCMTTGAPPGAVAPPTPTPPAQVIPPAPLPSGVTADITPTDLYLDNQPHGDLWVRITNNGPDTLTDKNVRIAVSALVSTLTVPPQVATQTPLPTDHILNLLAPGQTHTIHLAIGVDTSCCRYEFTVTATAQDFTDPNSANNTYKETVTPTPPPPPPPTGSVTLCEDFNYGGVCEKFTGPGGDEYLADNLIGNDRVSSIRVDPGTSAYLCEDFHWEGVCETFTADDPNLSDNPIGNDRVSAMAFPLTSPPPPGSVKLCENFNYGGICETFTVPVGDFNLTDNLIGNDRASSIRVGAGTSATLCEDFNYGGVCTTFTADDPNLSDNPIGNDRVSSLKFP